MTSPDKSESRRRALAFNAVGPAINSRGYWLPLSARRAVADAVLAAVDAEDDASLDAARRNAMRIQTLLDDTRDRIRKLHRPVERHGRIICAECSAYCGESTDNPPAPAPCPTITALEPPQQPTA